ncbi:MAG: DUF6249 domain-containing protein [Dysgonamonadaceae bacterium]|jgi:hypothetical protein|nr:DUF6249 domain-containing protein [Dysgonamonadaceae bacterium]
MWDVAVIGTLIPFGFFAAAVLIVWIVLKHSANEKKNRYHLVAKALEMGQSIPENLFAPQEKQEQKSFGYFKNAIIFLSLSTAFWAIFIYQKWHGWGDDEAFAFLFVSAFFTAFGAAWLIIGFLRRAQEQHEKRENAGK